MSFLDALFQSQERATRHDLSQAGRAAERQAARQVTAAAHRGAANPMAVAGAVADAQAGQRAAMAGQQAQLLAAARERDQQRAGQFVGSLIGAGASAIPMMTGGGGAAGAVGGGGGGAPLGAITGGLTQAATEQLRGPAAARPPVQLGPAPGGAGTTTRALTTPRAPAPVPAPEAGQGTISPELLRWLEGAAQAPAQASSDPLARYLELLRTRGA